MVPRVASAGRSFKGAARYYLHDKQADTSERVGFVETLNLPTDDPQRAVAHMIDTATHADQLKQAAGVKAGRKLQKPVYAYSLAWHPDQSPTQADQIAAARESLKALGLDDRQALIVSHTDQKHQHVHVIVNRVCPDTGKAASISNDRVKLSQWAQDYEKRHGQIFCPQRVENNEARDRGQWRKDTKSQSRREHREWKKAQTQELWDDFRTAKAELSASRKAQYEALYRQKEERFALRKAEIKALYKPTWRDVFKGQKEELKQFDASFKKRIAFAWSQSRGKALGLLKATFAQNDLRHDLLQRQEIERTIIAKRQGHHISDAGREITKAWKYDRDALRTAHKIEDDIKHQETKAQSRAVWDQRWSPTWKQQQEWQQVFNASASYQKPEASRTGAKGEHNRAASPEPQSQGKEENTSTNARSILKKSRENKNIKGGRKRERKREP